MEVGSWANGGGVYAVEAFDSLSEFHWAVLISRLRADLDGAHLKGAFGLSGP